jgi:hypothetical protein
MLPDDARHGTKNGYSAGCRCAPCTAGNTRAHKLYLLGRSPRLVDASGSRRRVRALLALGWTNLEVAEACGRTTREWAHYIATSDGRIREDIARDVAAAYERMSMTLPEGKYRNRGRTLARRKGWLPPLAWDDIDTDPEPTGWQYAAPDRAEQIADLADMGFGVTEVCRRLKLSREALQKWCGNHDMHATYRLLAGREYVVENQWTEVAS